MEPRKQKKEDVKLETPVAVKETISGIQNTSSLAQEFLFQTTDTANAEDGHEPEQVLQSVKAGVRAETEPVRQVSSLVSKELIREVFSDEKKSVLEKNRTYRNRTNIKKRKISSTLGKKAKQQAKKQTISKAKKSAEKVRNVSKEASIRTVSQVSGAVSGTTVVGAAVNEAASVINKQKEAAKQQIRKMREDKEEENTKSQENSSGKSFAAYGRELIGKSKQHAKQGFHIGLWCLLIFLPIFFVLSAPVLGLTLAYRSPLGVFLPSPDDSETVMDLITRYQLEFEQKVSDLYEKHPDCDSATIAYHTPEADVSGASYNNSYDIAIAYMILFRTSDTDVSSKEAEDVKTVFDKMTYYIEEKKTENDKKTLVIDVYKKSYNEMLDLDKLTSEEKKLIETVTSEQFKNSSSGNPVLPENMGMSSLTLEQKQKLMKNLKNGDKGSEVVLFAIDKLGIPYSQPKRDDGKHYDCSSLSYYAWNSQGISLMYEGANTAAQQAKYLHDKKCSVEYENMKPGDLIFYSWGSNGRYKDIGHVAIYCGSGMLCDASSSRGKVVYREVYSKDAIVFIGRPTKIGQKKD